MVAAAAASAGVLPARLAGVVVVALVLGEAPIVATVCFATALMEWKIPGAAVAAAADLTAGTLVGEVAPASSAYVTWSLLLLLANHVQLEDLETWQPAPSQQRVLRVLRARMAARRRQLRQLHA